MAGISFLEDILPVQHCGTVKRTSGTLKEYGVVVVYLHLDDDTRLHLPVNRRFESPLVFRIPKALSLEALMAQPGDFVYVEWLPGQCAIYPNVHAGVVARVTKFHLSRNVQSGYGDGFHKPNWFVG